MEKEIKLGYRNNPNAKAKVIEKIETIEDLETIATTELPGAEDKNIRAFKGVVYKSPKHGTTHTYFFEGKPQFYQTPHHTDIAVKMLEDIDQFYPIPTQESGGRFINPKQISEKFSDILLSSRDIGGNLRPIAADLMGLEFQYHKKLKKITIKVDSFITGVQINYSHVYQAINKEFPDEALNFVKQNLPRKNIIIEFDETEAHRSLKKVS
jgi:hypothetical protein